MAEETPVNDRLRDDEIDLFQFWEILIRRKKWIIICITLCLLVGCLYVFLKVPVYKFTTTIELGSISGSAFVSSEDLSTVLESSLVPKTSAAFKQEDKGSFIIKLSVPPNSRYLLLTTQGSVEATDDIEAFHHAVSDSLLHESLLVTEPARKALWLEISDARLKFEKLQNPNYYKVYERELTTKLLQNEQKMAALADREKFLTELERQQQTIKKLLEGQLAQSEQLVADSRKRFSLAVKEAGDEAKAMTMLMLTSQMQQEQDKISSLKERLNVDLEKQKQDLILQKESLGREKVLQKEQIEQVKDQLAKFKMDFASQLQEEKNQLVAIEDRLNAIKDVRVVGLAVRSVSPVGLGTNNVIAFFLVLGLVGGMLVAFLAEFFANKKQL